MPSRIPKSPGGIAHSIVQKCWNVCGGSTLSKMLDARIGEYSLYYFRAVLYWFKVLIEPPVFLEDGVQKATGEMRKVVFASQIARDVTLALLSSNLFSLYYTVWSSCQVVNFTDFEFPADLEQLVVKKGEELSALTQKLLASYQSNSTIQERHYSARGREFTMHKQYFFIRESKPIIDEIDLVLAQHYGLTDNELDFVINYDIKYRMGDALFESYEAGEGGS